MERPSGPGAKPLPLEQAFPCCGKISLHARFPAKARRFKGLIRVFGMRLRHLFHEKHRDSDLEHRP
jgi:hypothetical protein